MSDNGGEGRLKLMVRITVDWGVDVVVVAEEAVPSAGMVVSSAIGMASAAERSLI